MNRFSLQGKTTLITGATGILGVHFANALAEAGSNLVLIDLPSAKLEELAPTIASTHRIQALAVPCDVSKPQEVVDAVAAAERKFGKIDVLHNNAATKTSNLEAYFQSDADYSIETWRQIMSVNLDGMFLVAQAVGNHMIKNGVRGSVVQTSSIYGIMAPDQRIYAGSHFLGREINTPAAYTTSKHAVVGLTRHLASLWAKHGIRVNALALGGVESGQNTEFANRYSARVPLGRMAKTEDVLGPLLFLASDASSYMTGQVLAVDGGLSAW